MSLETINFNHIPLQPGDRLLDVGCGEGRHTISAYLLAEIHAVGLDLNATDIATARSRLADFPLEQENEADQSKRSCTFVHGSGHSLPFPDNSFDKVVCAEVLEHIPEYTSFLREIRRVLKPGGLLAVSVPRYFPEWVCWQLSDAYHEVEGGHVRIFRASELKVAVENQRMRRYKRHWAHSLHVPYWWLRCLLWSRGENARPVAAYHRLLVWDLMQRPPLTRFLDKVLNPIMGKSVVMYFVNEL